jgi:ceramide glucosyltransferase
MHLEILLIGVGLLLLIETIRSHWSLVASLRFRRPVHRLSVYPSVSVIRPIKGLDAGAEDNIQAALDHGYPGKVETLFVFDDEDEPALALVERAIAERRDRGQAPDARIVICGPPPKGRTGKLNAMIVALRQANNQLVAFVDSDTRPDQSALRVLVETLMGDPNSGSAFAPVVVSQPPRTWGDAGYAILLNGLYGPLAAEVARNGGGQMRFIMGQFMIFRRQALDAIGGLASAEGQLVDDMHLGELVTRAGYSNLVSPKPVPIIQYDLSIGQFIGIYVRWITFSRTGLPGLGFKIHSWLQAAVFFGGLALAASGAWLGSWPVAVIGLVASAALGASLAVLHLRLGGGRIKPAYWLVPALVMLSAPLVLLRIMLRREVTWRGRQYKLNRASRLDPLATPDDACFDCGPLSSTQLTSARWPNQQRESRRRPRA